MDLPVALGHVIMSFIFQMKSDGPTLGFRLEYGGGAAR
jgi:hypothetical protein